MKGFRMFGLMKQILVIVSLWLFSVNAFSQPDWVILDTINSGLASNIVNTIAIDAQNVKWIGTANGLNRFDDTSWVRYSADGFIERWKPDTTIATASTNVPPHNIISVLFFDAQGLLWVGTNGGGLASFDRNSTWNYFHTGNSDLPSNNVWSISEDDTGLWIGTWNGGVARFDKDTTWKVLNVSNSQLPSNNVRAIAVDSTGNKWFGTEGGGFAIYNDSAMTVYNSSVTDWPDDYVHDISFNGANYIATDDGLVSWMADSVYSVIRPTQSGHPSNVIWKIVPDGTINWLCTWGSGFMNLFTGDVFNTTNSDLPINTVWTAAVDANDIKWIGTDDGLALYKLGGVILGTMPGLLATEQIVIYPNPVHHQVVVRSITRSNLSVYDMMGRLVMRGESNQPMEVGHLTPGLYLVMVHGKVPQVGRFIKAE